jgi:hypothetical protein
MTREKLIEWQNKYNQQILESANQIDIPPRVVKVWLPRNPSFGRIGKMATNMVMG